MAKCRPLGILEICFHLGQVFCSICTFMSPFGLLKPLEDESGHLIILMPNSEDLCIVLGREKEMMCDSPFVSALKAGGLWKPECAYICMPVWGRKPVMPPCLHAAL